MAEQVFHVGVKALVRDGQGRVLLVRETAHQTSYYDIPGGRMEPGEDLLATLARELSEEIGVSSIARVEHLMTVLSNKQITAPHGKLALLLVIYEVVLDRGQTPKPSEDGLLLEWQVPAEAARLLADKYPAEFCNVLQGLAS